MASLAFYSYWDWRFTPLLAASIVINWVAAGLSTLKLCTAEVYARCDQVAVTLRGGESFIDVVDDVVTENHEDYAVFRSHARVAVTDIDGKRVKPRNRNGRGATHGLRVTYARGCDCDACSLAAAFYTQDSKYDSRRKVTA